MFNSLTEHNTNYGEFFRWIAKDLGKNAKLVEFVNDKITKLKLNYSFELYSFSEIVSNISATWSPCFSVLMAVHEIEHLNYFVLFFLLWFVNWMKKWVTRWHIYCYCLIFDHQFEDEKYRYWVYWSVCPVLSCLVHSYRTVYVSYWIDKIYFVIVMKFCVNFMKSKVVQSLVIALIRNNNDNEHCG